MSEEYLNFTEKLTEESVTARLKGYNDEWRKKSEDLYPKMESWYKLYRDQEYSLNGEPVKIPLVFTTIEIEKPHLLNNIFAQDPKVVDAEPKFNDPGNDKTTRVEAYVNSLICDTSKGRAKTQYFITNYLIYGIGVAKAYWNETSGKDIDPLTRSIAETNVAHPDFYVVDPFSFAWDDNKGTNDIQELEWVRERIFLSKNAMREIRDNGLCGNFTDEDMTSTEDKGKKVRNPNANADKGTYYDEFYVKLWDKKPILDENGEDTGETKSYSDEYRIWLLANDKIIKFEKNIFGRKPYVAASPYPVPFSIMGMGESEVIGGIANRMSLNSYQGGLLASKIGKSPYLIGPNSGLMPYNLNLLEEGVLFSKDINDVKPLPSIDPGNLEANIKYGEYLQGEAEMITGVTKFLQGTDIGTMTATQAALIAQNSTNRLATKLEQLQENYLAPLAEMLFLLAKQNETAPQAFRNSSRELQTLNTEDLYGEYTWSATSPITISNKALSLQQNITMIQMLAQAAKDSQTTPWPAFINYPKALAGMIQPNSDIADISQYFVPQDMLPQQGIQGAPAVNTTSPTPVSQTPGNAGSMNPQNSAQPSVGASPELPSMPFSPAPATPHPAGPQLG